MEKLKKVEENLKELTRLKRCDLEDRAGQVWDSVCDEAVKHNSNLEWMLDFMILGEQSSLRVCRARIWENRNWRGL